LIFVSANLKLFFAGMARSYSAGVRAGHARDFVCAGGRPKR